MKTIMSIDDSASMRRAIAFTLKGAGFEVVQAASGTEGLASLHDREIHLFLLDLNMPDMNGFEITRRLRSMPEYKFVPILLLTTESSVEKKQQGKAAGATGWIVKPFQAAGLLAVVNKVMR